MNTEILERIGFNASKYASSRIDDSDEDWSFQFERDYDTKFTKLIIKECLKVMTEKDDYYGRLMGDVIKKHFGITENNC